MFDRLAQSLDVGAEAFGGASSLTALIAAVLAIASIFVPYQGAVGTIDACQIRGGMASGEVEGVDYCAVQVGLPATAAALGFMTFFISGANVLDNLGPIKMGGKSVKNAIDMVLEKLLGMRLTGFVIAVLAVLFSALALWQQLENSMVDKNSVDKDPNTGFALSVASLSLFVVSLLFSGGCLGFCKAPSPGYYSKLR